MNYDPHDMPLNCKYIMSWALEFDHPGFENSSSLKATGADTDNFGNYVTLLAQSEVVVK